MVGLLQVDYHDAIDFVPLAIEDISSPLPCSVFLFDHGVHLDSKQSAHGPKLRSFALFVFSHRCRHEQRLNYISNSTPLPFQSNSPITTSNVTPYAVNEEGEHEKKGKEKRSVQSSLSGLNEGNGKEERDQIGAKDIANFVSTVKKKAKSLLKREREGFFFF